MERRRKKPSFISAAYTAVRIYFESNSIFILKMFRDPTTVKHKLITSLNQRKRIKRTKFLIGCLRIRITLVIFLALCVFIIALEKGLLHEKFVIFFQPFKEFLMMATVFLGLVHGVTIYQEIHVVRELRKWIKKEENKKIKKHA